MGELFRVAIDNPTINSTTTSRYPDRQTVSSVITASVGLLIASIGVCANAAVLHVLLRACRHTGNSVHILIVNQSAADLLASGFPIFTFIVMLIHGYNYNGTEFFDDVICVIFEGAALTAVGVVAGKIGLIVITLALYFKVVHAIAYRKYYRNWMTKVGVILPWIGGACFGLFPAIGTTRIVNGQCLRLGVWTNETIAKVSHTLLPNIDIILLVISVISCVPSWIANAFIMLHFVSDLFSAFIYVYLCVSTAFWANNDLHNV